MVLNNVIKIKSAIDDYFIYAKVEDNGMVYMWFSVDIEGDIPTSYQSLYNKYDLDKFYLTYFYPLFTCFNYISNPMTCLCVGLGAGHIPLFLQKKFPNMKLTVVEIDKSVYNVAKSIGFNGGINTKVYIDDGVTFIENTNDRYDMIIIDLDGEESFKNFDFSGVSKTLKEDGILAINCYLQNDGSELKNKLRRNFSCIKYYNIETNSIFLCRKNLNKFNEMMNKITLDTLPPMLNKYNTEYIEFMKTHRPKMLLN